MTGIAHRDDAGRDGCCCHLEHLTGGEANVLPSLSAGLTSKETALELHLSRRTVDGHVDRMLKKAGVDSREALLKLAEGHGVIDTVDGVPRLTGRTCLPRLPATGEQ